MVVETTSGQILPNFAELSVGNATDILVSLQCTGSGTATSVTWFQRLPSLHFIPLPTPFDLTTTSYSPATGLLQVFSSYLQDPGNLQDGRLTLFCVAANNVAVQVALRPGIEFHIYSVFSYKSSHFSSAKSVLHWSVPSCHILC